MLLDKGLLTPSVLDHRSPGVAVGQGGLRLVQGQEEDVVATVELIAVRQPAADLQQRVAQQGDRNADGTEFVVLAYRIRALGAGKRAFEPVPIRRRPPDQGSTCSSDGRRPAARMPPCVGVRVRIAVELVGDQPQGELGGLGKRRVGDLVADRPTAELELVGGQRPGELGVHVGEAIGRRAADLAQHGADRWAPGGQRGQLGQPAGRLGRGGRQAGQQVARLTVRPAEQVPAGEHELGEDRHQGAVQQDVDVDALL